VVENTALEIRSPPSPTIPVQPLTSLFFGTFAVLEGSSFVSVRSVLPRSVAIWVATDTVRSRRGAPPLDAKQRAHLTVATFGELRPWADPGRVDDHNLRRLGPWVRFPSPAPILAHQ